MCLGIIGSYSIHRKLSITLIINAVSIVYPVIIYFLIAKYGHKKIMIISDLAETTW